MCIRDRFYHLSNARICLTGKGSIVLSAWWLYHICGQKAEPVKSSVVYYFLVAGSIRLLNAAAVSYTHLVAPGMIYTVTMYKEGKSIDQRMTEVEKRQEIADAALEDLILTTLAI